MKFFKILVVGLGLSLLSLGGGFSFAGGVEYITTKAHQIIKVPMDGSNKIVVPAVQSRGGTPKSLKDLTLSAWGHYAINGAFYCPRSYKWCAGELADSTDKVRKSNGQLLSQWWKDLGQYDALFGFDAEGKVAPMARQVRGDVYWKDGGWENPAVDVIYNGIAAPVLVQSGVNVGLQNAEMNADVKQKKAGNKSFICSTADGGVVYMGFVNGQTFASMGDYLIKNFQCHNAILLDNGGTKAMWVKDKYVAGPGRNMMDAFVVIEGAFSQASTSVAVSESSKEEKFEKQAIVSEKAVAVSNAKVTLIQKILGDFFKKEHFSQIQIEAKLADLEYAFADILSSLPLTHRYYQAYSAIVEAIKTYPRH